MEGLWQVIRYLLAAAWVLPCSCHTRELQRVPPRPPVMNMSKKTPSGMGTFWTLVPMKIRQAKAGHSALPAREAPFI